MNSREVKNLPEPPHFSIVLATGGALDWLEDALASVQKQTFTSWELLVVVYKEDQKEAVEEYIRAIDDPRIRMVGICASGNASLSRNLGAKVASGKYFTFLDEDDMWHPAHLKLHAMAWENHPEGGLAFSHVFLFWEGEELEPYIPPRYEGTIDDGFLMNQWRSDGPWPIRGTSTISIPADIFHEIGGFDEAVLVSDDMDIQYTIARRYPIISLPEATVARRQHFRGRLTRSQKKRITVSSQVIEKKFQIPDSTVSSFVLNGRHHNHIIDWSIHALRGEELFTRMLKGFQMKNKPEPAKPRHFIKWLLILFLGIKRFHRFRATRRGGKLLGDYRAYLKGDELEGAGHRGSDARG